MPGTYHSVVTGLARSMDRGSVSERVALSRSIVDLDRGPRALAVSAVGSAMLVAVGLFGPNAVALDVQAGGWLPPYAGPWQLGPWGATVATLVGLGLAAWGLWRTLAAVSAGWLPSPRRLVAAGAATAGAYCLVSPMGSDDVLLYAVYGRIAALGGDPYTGTATQLAATGDPIGAAAEGPWLDTPSVYGPLEVFRQSVASHLGGSSIHITVLALAVTSALAYVATGLLLLRLVGQEPARRARVAVMWSANPILLYAVVGGAHNDTVPILLGVAALLVLKRSRAGAGALLGLAGLAKLSLGLWGAAAVWAVRSSRKQVWALALGAAGVMIPGYLIAGRHSLDQVAAASHFVGSASPWRPVRSLLEWTLGGTSPARTLVPLLAWVLMLVVLRWLPAMLPADEFVDGVVSRDVVRAAALVSAAWLLTAPYTLAWYDMLVWAPLAALGTCRLDQLMIVRTTVLLAVYQPGRPIELPPLLHDLSTVARAGIAPVVGVGLLGWVWLRYREATRVWGR